MLDEFLQKPFINVDRSLDICFKFNLLRGVALLQQREGNYQEAMNTYEKYFKKLDYSRISQAIVHTLHDEVI